MNRNTLIISGSVLAGLTFGSVGGFLVARRILETKYEEIVKREIAETKKFYSALHKKNEFATPAEAAEKLLGANAVPPIMDEAVEALRSYQGVNKYHPGVSVKPKVEEVIANIFQQADEGVDIETEVRRRSEEAPYIISKAEFFENAPEYTQDTLTYYAGDEVLADQQDQAFEDVDQTVGLNCLRFGHRSEDKNVVYIRNDSLDRDFEVLRSEGKYAEEVAGFRSD